jgi:hypothetical protein
MLNSYKTICVRNTMFYMSSLIINFDTFDHSFCESNVFSDSREYVNCSTALFISFVGWFGLVMNSPEDNTVFLYHTLVINGITSALYHYTHYIGWGLMDRYSMILIAVYCFKIFFTVFEIVHVKNHRFIKFLSVLYLTCIQTVAGLHHETQFNNMFGGVLISILIFLFKVRNSAYSICPALLTLAFKGMFLIKIGGILWILTENFCNTIGITKYLFGHGLWHICVALGGYYISLLPIYIQHKKGVPKLKLKYKLNLPYLSNQ